MEHPLLFPADVLCIMAINVQLETFKKQIKIPIMLDGR